MIKGLEKSLLRKNQIQVTVEERRDKLVGSKLKARWSQ